MELNLETFALPPLIDDVVKTIEPLAAKNGKSSPFLVRIPLDGTPVAVYRAPLTTDSMAVARR